MLCYKKRHQCLYIFYIYNFLKFKIKMIIRKVSNNLLSIYVSFTGNYQFTVKLAGLPNNSHPLPVLWRSRRKGGKFIDINHLPSTVYD